MTPHQLPPFQKIAQYNNLKEYLWNCYDKWYSRHHGGWVRRLFLYILSLLMTEGPGCWDLCTPVCSPPLTSSCIVTQRFSPDPCTRETPSGGMQITAIVCFVWTLNPGMDAQCRETGSGVVRRVTPVPGESGFQGSTNVWVSLFCGFVCEYQWKNNEYVLDHNKNINRFRAGEKTKQEKNDDENDEWGISMIMVFFFLNHFLNMMYLFHVCFLCGSP